MTKKLNIAIVAEPILPVPPLYYGGIERVIDMVIKGLLNRGHAVSLFAHADSQTDAKLYPYPRYKGERTSHVNNTWLINKELFTNKFDVLHSFGRLAYLLPLLSFQMPKLMSYQRKPTVRQVKTASLIARKNTLFFTGCSDYITEQISPYAPSYTVYNGVDLGIYSYISDVGADAPLCFLGRIEPIKGVHMAIEIAKRSKKKLIIAGNVANEHENYFNERVQPELNDQIFYIGEVNDKQKNHLLGSCSALLMPILWDEPFGIVMIEAMACGTPVIGFKRGSVLEVVDHNTTGFYGDTLDELVTYVGMINKISRKTVKTVFDAKFSSDIIVEKYLKVYEEIIYLSHS